MRVFVDSNVLFSACHKRPNRFELFWSVPGVVILTSQYSVDEVSRHLHQPPQRAQLWRLVGLSTLVDGGTVSVPPDVTLPAKDLPILQAALGAEVAILVSGDLKHFRPFFGQTIRGTLVESPESFRRRYPEHFSMERTEQ